MTTRIALVTGGSRGLGRSTALALADTGTDVVVTYVADEAAARDVVAQVEARGRRSAALRLDVTEMDAFAAFADELRAVLTGWDRTTFDVLVHNAGRSGDTPLGATDAAVVDDLFRTHVVPVVLLTQQLLALLADGGRILTVSTGLTQNLANPAYSVYAAMKGAVEVYTRYLAKSLGPRRIAVNAIAPGATATDFAGGLIRDDDGYRARIEASSAMGRVGQPDDIGRAAAAILAEGAGWVTGQRIEASGGQGMGWVGQPR